LAFGWEYVVVDIQWYEPGADGSKYHAYVPLCLDAYGRPIPAENRFPSAVGGAGFKPLADQIHAMGLKFGIHMMRGVPRQAAHQGLPILGTEYTCRDIATERVCRWNFDMYGVNPAHPAALAWYQSQAQLWASWGVDYVKVDDICTPYHEEECELLREALDSTGRPIALSLSPGDADLTRARHYQQHAQAWRISGDFWDSWRQLERQYDLCADWAPYAGAGHWPDADMLPLGLLAVRSTETNAAQRRTRFTPAEQAALMSLWCLVRSPLMLGGELRGNTPEDLALITKADVLAVSKDARNTRRALKDNWDQIWLADGSDCRYLLILNTASFLRQVSLLPDELGLPHPAVLQDLWSGETRPLDGGLLRVGVEGHGARLFSVV